MSINRRGFLGSSLGIGAGMTLMGATGCSDTDDNFEPEPVQPQSATTIRFHLNLVDFAPLKGSLYLATAGKRSEVLEHDQASLAEYEGSGKPTHYAIVEPIERVTIAWVVQVLPEHDNGECEWVHIQVVVPSLDQSGSAGATAPLACFGEPSLNGGPEDIAVALAFHHPELMSLDKAEAVKVTDYLYCLLSIAPLAEKIKTLGRASEQGGGWAKLVPIEKDQTKPGSGDYLTQTTSNGNIERVYALEVNDELDILLGEFVVDALNKVKADASLPNKQYQSQTQAAVTSSVAKEDFAAAAPGFTVVPAFPDGHTESGVKWVSTRVIDAKNRVVEVEIKNNSFRYYSVFALFLGADGKPLTLEQVESDKAYFPSADNSPETRSGIEQYGFEPKNILMQFQTILGAQTALLGIPVNAGGSVIQVAMPKLAVKIQLQLGSAGLTGESPPYPYLLAAPLGMAATVVAQGVIPAVLLIKGLGSDNLTLVSLFKGPLIMALITFLIAEGGAGFAAYMALQEQGEARQEELEQASKNLTSGLTGATASLALALTKVLAGIILAGTVAPAVAGLAKLAGWVAEETGEEEAADVMPFLGITYKLVSVAATLEVMGQTSSQIINNPPVLYGDFSIEQRVEVTINHDLDASQIPATATHYQAILTAIGGQTLQSDMIELDSTGAGPTQLTHSFTGVPSGGRISVHFVFYAGGAGNIVASGNTASYSFSQIKLAQMAYQNNNVIPPLPKVPDSVIAKLRVLVSPPDTPNPNIFINTPDLLARLKTLLGEDDASTYGKKIAEVTADIQVDNPLQEDGVLKIECTLQNRLLPLTADSTFDHRQKLVLDNDIRQWQSTPTAPDAGINNFTGSTADGSIGGVATATQLQRNGQFAYSWRSAADKLTACGSSISNTQLYTMQTVSLTDNPQSGWHRALTNGQDCGQQVQPALAFDLMGSSSGIGNHFAVVQGKNAAGTEAHYVHRVSADVSTAISISDDNIVGQFTIAPTSLSVHPAGYLLAVNATYNKLQILKLPANDTATVGKANAPLATPFGGTGSLPGLMNGATLVRSSLRGEIYVLEKLNRRVQAFTVNGEPRIPASWRSSAMSLDATGVDVDILDMGVDAAEYLYILGYSSNGFSAQDFVLDVYDNTGVWLFRKTGMAASRMSVDLWRNIYTVNYERLVMNDGRAEPSISLWIPYNPS